MAVKQKGRKSVRTIGHDVAPSIRADGIYAVGALRDGTVQIELGENILVPIPDSPDTETMIRCTGHLRLSSRVAAELAKAIEHALKELRSMREQMRVKADAKRDQEEGEQVNTAH